MAAAKAAGAGSVEPRLLLVQKYNESAKTWGLAQVRQSRCSKAGAFETPWMNETVSIGHRWGLPKADRLLGRAMQLG